MPSSAITSGAREDVLGKFLRDSEFKQGKVSRNFELPSGLQIEAGLKGCPSCSNIQKKGMALLTDSKLESLTQREGPGEKAVHLKDSSLSEQKPLAHASQHSCSTAQLCSDCQSKQLKESDSSYLRVSQLTTRFQMREPYKFDSIDELLAKHESESKPQYTSLHSERPVSSLQQMSSLHSG